MSHCSHLRSEYARQGTTGRPENHPFASCRLARLARLCAHNLTCLKLLLLLLQCCCNAAGLLRSTVRGSGASSPPSSLAALASSAESGGTTSSTPKSIGMPGAWKRSASLSQLTRYVLVPNQMLVRPLSHISILFALCSLPATQLAYVSVITCTFLSSLFTLLHAALDRFVTLYTGQLPNI